MAKKRDRKSENDIDFSKVAAHVVDTPLEQEIEQSFLSYAYMVILARAIPDVRDGLKPVHRRVLYSMLSEDKVTPDKPYTKVVGLVGSAMKLHPFGDSALGGALVRLGQDFAMRLPLIDGHGNFGMPGVSAASPRYIEARLSKAAMPLLDDLGEDAVNMRPSYDGKRMEPEVLPARYPNLLINGTSGIAVGMATNIAQHNPDEVMNAVKYLLRHPKAKLKQIMRYIPAPDFATGGVLVGSDQIEESFRTGRGTFRIRGKYRVEVLPRGKHEIVFYELPYEVSAESILVGINKARDAGKLAGLAYAADLTDMRKGMNLVIETKSGVDPQMLVLELFGLTNLEVSFGVNSIAIVNNEPRLLGIVEMLQLFIDFRRETVRRRSIFRKTKKETRLHLLLGRLKALVDIDEVIRIVREADTPAIASVQLQKHFKIDETQAEDVLDIPLRKLTKLDRIAIETERDKLIKEIAELTEIINNPAALDDLLHEEFNETQKIISSPRQTQILEGSLDDFINETKAVVAQNAPSEEGAGPEIEDKPCVISLTAKGGLIRTDDIPKKAMRATITSNLRDRFIMVTNQGRAFRVDTVFVGETESKADALLHKSLHSGEFIMAITPENLADGKTGGIALGTVQGNVKICAPQWPMRSDEFNVIRLDEGDYVVSATWVDDITAYDFVFLTSNAALLTFPADKVRPQGLTGGGVAGITLKDGGQVIGFDAVLSEHRDQYIVVQTTGLKTKATPFLADLYPSKGRATGGYTAYAFTKGEDQISYAGVKIGGALFDERGRAIALPPLVHKRSASGTVM